MSPRLKLKLTAYMPSGGTIVRIEALNPLTGERVERIGASLKTLGDVDNVQQGLRTAVGRALNDMNVTLGVRWATAQAEKLIDCTRTRDVVKVQVWFDRSEPCLLDR